MLDVSSEMVQLRKCLHTSMAHSEVKLGQSQQSSTGMAKHPPTRMWILPAKILRNSSFQESRVSSSGGLLPGYVHEAGSRPVNMHNTVKSGLLTVHSSHSSLGQRLG